MKEFDVKAFKSLCNAKEFDQAEFNRLFLNHKFLEVDIGEGFTPLQYAMQCIFLEIPQPEVAARVASELIKAGANPQTNNTDKNWYAPIELAVMTNQNELIDLMFTVGKVDPNFCGKNNWPLLYTAATYEVVKPETVQLLLQNNVSPETKGETLSSLDFAEGVAESSPEIKSYAEKVELMKQYISFKADIRKQFDQLCQAENLDRKKLGELLKIKNFLRMEFDDGNTPLHLALKSDKVNQYLVQDLISAKSDINRKNKEGKSPLEIALERKEYFIAYLLIIKGAVLDVPLDKSKAFLMKLPKDSIPLKDEEVIQGVKRFLNSTIIKADFLSLCNAEKVDYHMLMSMLSVEGFINADMGKGFTPLQVAILHIRKNPKVAMAISKVLIMAGTELNHCKTKKFDFSPIAMAIRYNHVELVNIMLANGADATIKTKKNRTLLDVAKEYKADPKIIEAIEKYIEAAEAKKVVKESAPEVKEQAVVMPSTEIVQAAEAIKVVRESVPQVNEPAEVMPSTKIARVLEAMVDGKKTVLVIKDLEENDEFRRSLVKEINWTALKSKKINNKDLISVSTVLNDIVKSDKGKYSCNLLELSPEVQKALFNIVAYAGKLNAEPPSRFEHFQKIKEDKYNTTIDFLKNILNASPDQLEAKVKEFMKKPEITANRGTRIYKLHGLFSKKGLKVKSTMQELFFDLNKVIETEKHSKLEKGAQVRFK